MASENDLLAAARHGSPDALEALIQIHQPRVYRFGIRMCGNPDDASDVLQDTLLAMARSIREFRGESSMSTWLYTIARSFCIKKRRRRKSAPRHEESLEALSADQLEGLSDPADNPEEQAARREVDKALDAAIQSLDPAQREVLVLRDIENLSAREVALVTGSRVEAVKSRLHRARLAVRQKMAPVLGISAAPRRRTRCPDVLTHFSRHLEGELAPHLCAEMEAHLEQCPHCRGACDSLKRTLALCRATPAPTVPPSIEHSVRLAIRAFLPHHSP